MRMSVGLEVTTKIEILALMAYRLCFRLTHLASPSSGKDLGHFGHLKRPFGRGKGTTSWVTSPAADRGGGVKDASLLDIDPFKVCRGVVDCDSGDMEVWYPLSSSNEGLETESEGMSGTKETSCTALSTASFWLASETNLERSRTKSGLTS